jgi:hypothetical protein
MNELSTPGQNAPAPGSPPVPLPVVGQTVTTGSPPDYAALGAGQAQADFAAASANGGWKFDPDAISKVIKELQDSLDNEYLTAKSHAGWLTQIIAPGSDLASMQYTASAVTSGGAYGSFLQSAIDYTQAYVKTLTDIRTAYQNQDHAALDALRGIGKAQ